MGTKNPLQELEEPLPGVVPFEFESLIHIHLISFAYAVLINRQLPSSLFEELP